MKSYRPFRPKDKRTRRSKRYWSLKDGTFSFTKKNPKRGYGSFHTIKINKFNSKSFVLKFGKPITSYAYWYKIFGYRDLDELYQIIGHGKYREDK